MTRRDGKLRIAICSAAVGHGHGRAAHALADGLRVLRPDAKVSIIDALSLAPAWFVHGYRDAYLATIARMPALAGWMYSASDRPQRGAGIGSTLERFAMRRLGTDPLVARADVVVCTHFLCGRVLSALRRNGRLASPLVISVTDQHPHGVWLAPHADILLVASESARTTAIASGIRPERVRVTGIPIDRRFGKNGAREEARTMLGLPQDRRVALVSG
ncbi:MAG: MGDG synthase family glycosyltransferase, partial [Myxococcota bacterium]